MGISEDLTNSAFAGAMASMLTDAGPLHQAIAAGDVKRVKSLLTGTWLENKADPNEKCSAGPPLMLAIGFGHEEIVDLLLSHGADPHYQPPIEGGLEVFATKLGRPDIAESLIRKKESTSPRPANEETEHRTPNISNEEARQRAEELARHQEDERKGTAEALAQFAQTADFSQSGPKKMRAWWRIW